MGQYDRRQYVYIAGPLSSSGDYTDNIRAAVEAAEYVMEHGGIPYIPHLCSIWEMMLPHGDKRDFFLPYDFAWLEKCNAVYRLPGESIGADAEVKYAQKLGLPVFYRAQAVAAWLVMG